MSTSPYSQDLRKKVISYLLSGKSQKSAAQVFKLNQSTISRWWLRHKKEGHCLPRKRLGRAPRLTTEAVKAYVDTHPNFIAAEMGEHFNMTGAGALYWLKKFGYSFKKKHSPTWRRTKKSEKSTKK